MRSPSSNAITVLIDALSSLLSDQCLYVRSKCSQDLSDPIVLEPIVGSYERMNSWIQLQFIVAT